MSTSFRQDHFSPDASLVDLSDLHLDSNNGWWGYFTGRPAPAKPPTSTGQVDLPPVVRAREMGTSTTDLLRRRSSVGRLRSSYSDHTLQRRASIAARQSTAPDPTGPHTSTKAETHTTQSTYATGNNKLVQVTTVRTVVTTTTSVVCDITGVEKGGTVESMEVAAHVCL